MSYRFADSLQAGSFRIIYSKNKFEKLVHLVGFIIRINTAHGLRNICCVLEPFPSQTNRKAQHQIIIKIHFHASIDLIPDENLKRGTYVMWLILLPASQKMVLKCRSLISCEIKVISQWTLLEPDESSRHPSILLH